MMNFLKKIQESDEKTKRRWLFIISGVLMLIIVSFWISYMTATIRSPQNESPKNQISFVEIFKAGTIVVWDEMKKQFIVVRDFVGSAVGVKNTFQIEEARP